MINIEIRKLADQCEKYIKSNNKLLEMISTEDIENKWSESFHLIDHDWLLNWKDVIAFDNLDKESYKGNKSNIDKYFDKNKSININKIEKLDNSTIYYDKQKINAIDPMKSFDIVTDEVWNVLNINNDNLNFNGKISILKGNNKIIIKFDEDNYCVKYLTNDQNIFGEFLVSFNSEDNSLKKQIIDEISYSNIYKWMEEINFKFDSKDFITTKYKIPFNIKQKSNNYKKDKKDDISFDISNYIFSEGLKYISFSNTSYSFACNSTENKMDFSFLNSSEFINYFSHTENFRLIRKYGRTSGLIEVIRCLSMIEPLAEYFMSNIGKFKIFSRFQSNSLLNIIRDFFQNFWSDEKSDYYPKQLTHYIKEKTAFNINEEQDPINFLDYVINHINNKLNKIDMNIDFNFNDIVTKKEKEKCSYLEDLKNISTKYNSISGKYFYGLMLYKYEFNKCKKEIEKVEAFNKIDLDYKNIINNILENNVDGYSFESTSIDFLLKYYFLSENTSILCPNCGIKAKMIKKEILEYPQYLIIRLNQGKFDAKKGFIENIEIPIQDIKYEKITEISNNSGKNINFEYNLIGMINYCNKDEKIYFLSIFKSPIIQFKDVWILFLCDAKPEQLVQSYENEYSKPYILFYKIQKIKK